MPDDDREPPEWSAALAAELGEAAAAATAIAGPGLLGLRAVEPREGHRWYLCALEGPAFLCLRRDLTRESGERRVHEVASGSLLVERAEAMIDGAELRYFAGAAGRLLAVAGEPGELEEAIEAAAQRALLLAEWRESAQREVASVAALDTAIALHEAFTRAYGHFVSVSEPLVEHQDELPPEAVSGLRVFEEAAGRAGVGEALAARLGAAMEDCDEGAAQVVAAHVLPLG